MNSGSIDVSKARSGSEAVPSVTVKSVTAKVTVGLLSGLLGKTRQGYHANIRKEDERAAKRQARNAAVLAHVRAYRKQMPKLGTVKLLKLMQADLARVGIRIGRDTLFQLLGKEGLLIYPRRPYHPHTTNSNHRMKKYSNLIKGDGKGSSTEFVPTGPNQLWVSDITYVRLRPEWLYLSLITDAYSHTVVGWALSENLSHTGPIKALQQALRQRVALPDGSYPPLIHHSDRGTQYCCQPYVELLQKLRIAISMTENGDPYENAIAERMNGILKYEFEIIEGFKNWLQALKHIGQAIKIYNTERPHMSIDYMTPCQAHKSTGALKRCWKNTPLTSVN